MSEPIVSTLNIPFEDVKDETSRIVLRQASKRFDALGALAVHCFPSSGVSFVASVGRVETAEVRSWDAWEGLKFNNSATATLQYPGATSVVLHTDAMVLMQKTKNLYGKTVIIPASGVMLRWIPEEEVVVAETSLGIRVPVYGACFVQYQALYRVLAYYPDTQITPVGGGNYSFVWTVGTLFAYNETDVQTVDLELDIKESPDYVEFARVTSKIVLDAKGVWEFPKNWESTHDANREKIGDQREDYPEDGKFDDHPQAGEIDATNSFVDTRVHHIVRINSLGVLIHEDFNNGGDDYWAWFNPYFGYSTYNPKYEIVYANPPGGEKANSAKDFKYDQNHTTWRDVFLQVDKAALESDLRKWYPGASKYSRPKS